jgi:hypothetical protein
MLREIVRAKNLTDLEKSVEELRKTTDIKDVA